MNTAEKLQAAISGEARPVLVEFYADWCPHCQRMMPIVDQLRQEVGGKADIIQIDGDKNPDLMEKISRTRLSHLDSFQGRTGSMARQRRQTAQRT